MRANTAGNTDVPLLDETIGRNFERVAARFPFHDALVEAAQVPGGDARRWSYSKMNDDVDRLARALLALGVGKGDRVGVWSPDCAEWTLLQYAAAKAGAVLIGLGPDCGSRELEHLIRHSGLSLLVVAPSDAHRDYVGIARSALNARPQLQQVVFLPDHGMEGLDAGVPLTEAELTYAELLRKADGVGHAALKDRMSELDAHTPAVVEYAFDSTGALHEAPFTHADVLNGGFTVGGLLGYTEHDRVVLPVPLSQRFGQVAGCIAALSHGAAVIIPARTFSPSAVLEAVQDFGGTSLYGVPAMFSAELAEPDFDTYDLATLQTGVIAGAPPAELLGRITAEMTMKLVQLDQDGQVLLEDRPGEKG